MVASSFRRFAGGAGLAALMTLLFAGVAEAACGDCSGHHDMALTLEMSHDAHGAEDHPPCCNPDDLEPGSVPDLPFCPHSVAATGCAGAATLPAVPAEPLNTGFPTDLGHSTVTETPNSPFAAPPFQPPRT